MVIDSLRIARVSRVDGVAGRYLNTYVRNCKGSQEDTIIHTYHTYIRNCKNSKESMKAWMGDLSLWRHKAVCFPRPAFLRRQVVIEVQGQSRFLQGLMPGSIVLFHKHRLNFRKLDTRVNTQQTGGTRTKIKEIMLIDTNPHQKGCVQQIFG